MLVIECPQSTVVPKEELKLNASHVIEASLMLFFVAVCCYCYCLRSLVRVLISPQIVYRTKRRKVLQTK